MKLAIGSALAALLFVSPAFARSSKEVTCSDGTTAKGGRGACSGHGGIGTSAKAAASSAKPSRTSEGPDASSAGATAKCKDGSFSHAKGHAGACSRHKGVAQWLDGSK
jgi:hypothetical protein